MNVLCIDPGTEVSGAVVYNGEKVRNIYPEFKNDDLLQFIYEQRLPPPCVLQYGNVPSRAATLLQMVLY